MKWRGRLSFWAIQKDRLQNDSVLEQPMCGCHLAFLPLSKWQRFLSWCFTILNNLHLESLTPRDHTFQHCAACFNHHHSCWFTLQPTSICNKSKQCLNLVAITIFVHMSAGLSSVGTFGILTTSHLISYKMVSHIHTLGYFMIH